MALEKLIFVITIAIFVLASATSGAPLLSQFTASFRPVNSSVPIGFEMTLDGLSVMTAERSVILAVCPSSTQVIKAVCIRSDGLHDLDCLDSAAQFRRCLGKPECVLGPNQMQLVLQEAAQQRFTPSAMLVAVCADGETTTNFIGPNAIVTQRALNEFPYRYAPFIMQAIEEVEAQPLPRYDCPSDNSCQVECHVSPNGNLKINRQTLQLSLTLGADNTLIVDARAQVVASAYAYVKVCVHRFFFCHCASPSCDGNVAVSTDAHVVMNFQFVWNAGQLQIVSVPRDVEFTNEQQQGCSDAHMNVFFFNVRVKIADVMNAAFEQARQKAVAYLQNSFNLPQEFVIYPDVFLLYKLTGLQWSASQFAIASSNATIVATLRPDGLPPFNVTYPAPAIDAGIAPASTWSMTAPNPKSKHLLNLLNGFTMPSTCMSGVLWALHEKGMSHAAGNFTVLDAFFNTTVFFDQPFLTIPQDSSMWVSVASGSMDADCRFNNPRHFSQSGVAHALAVSFEQLSVNGTVIYTSDGSNGYLVPVLDQVQTDQFRPNLTYPQIPLPVELVNAVIASGAQSSVGALNDFFVKAPMQLPPNIVPTVANPVLSIHHQANANTTQHGYVELDSYCTCDGVGWMRCQTACDNVMVGDSSLPAEFRGIDLVDDTAIAADFGITPDAPYFAWLFPSNDCTLSGPGDRLELRRLFPSERNCSVGVMLDGSSFYYYFDLAAGVLDLFMDSNCSALVSHFAPLALPADASACVVDRPRSSLRLTRDVNPLCLGQLVNTTTLNMTAHLTDYLVKEVSPNVVALSIPAVLDYLIWAGPVGCHAVPGGEFNFVQRTGNLLNVSLGCDGNCSNCEQTYPNIGVVPDPDATDPASFLQLSSFTPCYVPPHAAPVNGAAVFIALCILSAVAVLAVYFWRAHHGGWITGVRFTGDANVRRLCALCGISLLLAIGFFVYPWGVDFHSSLVPFNVLESAGINASLDQRGLLAAERLWQVSGGAIFGTSVSIGIVLLVLYSLGLSVTLARIGAVIALVGCVSTVMVPPLGLSLRGSTVPLLNTTDPTALYLLSHTTFSENLILGLDVSVIATLLCNLSSLCLRLWTMAVTGLLLGSLLIRFLQDTGRGGYDIGIVSAGVFVFLEPIGGLVPAVLLGQMFGSGIELLLWLGLWALQGVTIPLLLKPMDKQHRPWILLALFSLVGQVVMFAVLLYWDRQLGNIVFTLLLSCATFFCGVAAGATLSADMQQPSHLALADADTEKGEKIPLISAASSAAAAGAATAVAPVAAYTDLDSEAPVTAPSFALHLQEPPAALHLQQPPPPPQQQQQPTCSFVRGNLSAYVTLRNVCMVAGTATLGVLLAGFEIPDLVTTPARQEMANLLLAINVTIAWPQGTIFDDSFAYFDRMRQLRIGALMVVFMLCFLLSALIFYNKPGKTARRVFGILTGMLVCAAVVVEAVPRYLDHTHLDILCPTCAPQFDAITREVLQAVVGLICVLLLALPLVVVSIAVPLAVMRSLSFKLGQGDSHAIAHALLCIPVMTSFVVLLPLVCLLQLAVDEATRYIAYALLIFPPLISFGVRAFFKNRYVGLWTWIVSFGSFALTLLFNLISTYDYWDVVRDEILSDPSFYFEVVTEFLLSNAILADILDA